MKPFDQASALGTTPSTLTGDALRELHLFVRLAREWDLRFETMYKSGALAKWYSSVGNEGITVPAATAIERGDALLTLHRDSGAILRTYIDPNELFPGLLESPGFPKRQTPGGSSEERLYRLACQMLGKRDGYSAGVERSYHYNHVDEEAGIHHVGMISHLGSMIPVAAGTALGLKQRGTDRVAINFIGDGATSTGDFHEGLNMAAVLDLPFILIIENNQYAFSTPCSEQFRCESLADRAKGYGIPGHRVNGNDPEAMFHVMTEAVARARRGEGPTLIEAVVGRLRGHSQGDDSFSFVPKELVERFEAEEPVSNFERRLVSLGVYTEADIDRIGDVLKETLIRVIDRAVECPAPDPSAERPVFADQLPGGSVGR